MNDLRTHWEWSRGIYGYFIPHAPSTSNNFQKFLMQVRVWYDDSNQPTICECQSAHGWISLMMLMV